MELLFGETTGSNKSAKAPDAPSPSDRSQPTASSSQSDTVAEIWSKKSQAYLNSGDFPSTITSTETRSPKERARTYGLRHFDSMDTDKDGKIEHSTILAKDFADGQKDMFGARVMLENFDVIDKSHDGFIDKRELIATASDKVKLPHLPTTVNRDPWKIDATDTNRVIAERLASHPNKSPHDYLDISIKALSSAISKGDIKAVDAMVKTFSDSPDALKKVQQGVAEALKGSGSGLWLDGPGYLTVASLENQVTFSKSDKPWSRNFRVSAEDALKEIGRNAADSDKKIKSAYEESDREEIAVKQDEKVLDGLSTKLMDSDKPVAMLLLKLVRHEDTAYFKDVWNRQLEKDPQSADRIRIALGEIARGQQ